MQVDKNMVLAIIAIVAIVIVGALVYAKSGNSMQFNLLGSSTKEIGQKAVDYINNNGLSQTPASLVNTSDYEGLIKIKIKIGQTEFDSYATKNGKLLFPQGFDMTTKKDDAGKKTGDNTKTQGQTAEQIIAGLKKSDKPMIEAYIVARCPFGLQMQRMIADAIKSVPALAENVKVRYIGEVSGNKITSMHGDAEATENLRQICIREEQPAKYWDYVSCQMKGSGKEDSCASSTGVDLGKLNSCVSDPKKGVAYAQKDFDAAGKLSVSGSPTLIVNGATVEEFTADNQPVFGSARSSDEIKTIVCDASNKKADFCSKKLNTAQAATSFSETYASSGTTGSGNTNCGN